MAKKKWKMLGLPKVGAAKVSKTMAEVGQQYKKEASGAKLMKMTQVALPGKIAAAVKTTSKGIGGMGARRKGWKKPGRRGIMGL